MTLYMKFIHIWSVNIILLMFIFGAIGYIFNEKSSKVILTDRLLRYYHIMFIIAIISGTVMVIENNFWMSFPTFQYKLFVILMIIAASLLSRRLFPSTSNIRSILTIALIILVYSISLLIGSFVDV